MQQQLEQLAARLGERWKPLTIGVAAAVAVAVSEIELVSVLVNGLQVGSVYALVALGIALVYKATRVLNFAQGELGTVPAFLAFLLLGGRLDGELDTVAVSGWQLLGVTAAAMVAGAALAIAVNLLVVKRLASSTAVTTLVGTAGVALFLTAGELILFDAKARKFPRFIDGAPCLERGADGACAAPLAIGGVVVPWHTIIVVGVLAAAAVVLALFFRTPVGVALLATAQEPYAAELQGVSTTAMSVLAWGAAGALAAVGGILGGGVFEFIAPGFMTTTFLIPAIVAAVLGGITSMVGAVVGGLLLGVSVAFANGAALAYDLTSTLPGPPQIMTFAVLLLVLLVRPRGLFGEEA